MIDTSKYEGHTEGNWEYNTDDDGWTLTVICERDDPDRDVPITLMTKPNGEPNLTMNANFRLIADAPLLLAEVKRLREENDVLAEAVKEDNEILKKHIETLAEVKRLREQYLELRDELYDLVGY